MKLLQTDRHHFFETQCTHYSTKAKAEHAWAGPLALGSNPGIVAYPKMYTKGPTILQIEF